MSVFKFLVFFLLFTQSIRAQTNRSAIAVSLDNHKELAENETEYIIFYLKPDKNQIGSVSRINTEYFLRIAELRPLKLSLKERSRHLARIESERRSRLERILGKKSSEKYFYSLDQKQASWHQKQTSLLSDNQQKNK